MEKLLNNLKYAAKNVFGHLREFSAFFIAVFVIQVFFGVVSLCYYNNNNIDYSYASDGYDYHLELRNLNSDQYYYFMNNEEYSNRAEDAIYDVTKIVERNKNSLNNTRYDVFIRLYDDAPENLRRFNSRYLKGFELNGDGNYSIEYTPLMQYQNNIGTNRWVFILSLALMMLVSLYLMVLLFGYRLNHFKFTYGIYLTFGANFKKLYSSSLWEMLFVTLVTFIPACVTSGVLSFFIYSAKGVAFTVNMTAFIIMLAFSLAVNSVAVLAPIKHLAVSTPLRAIKAEDNTNYVSSPKRSSDRLTKAFPLGYILNDIIRYRKYVVKLVFSGVLFSMAFMGAAYFSDLYHAGLHYNSAAYTLDFSAGGDVYTDDMYTDITAIDGVETVIKREEISADTAGSHILLDRGDVGLFSESINATVGGERVAVSNSFTYRPLDLGTAKYITDNFKYDGDVYSAVDAENKLVISVDRYNKTALKLKPGDTVQVATFLAAHTVPETYETGKKYMRQQLDCNYYSYREYTVAAVIYDMPCGSETPVYLPCIDYTVLTKQASDFTLVDVYFSPELTAEEKNDAADALRTFAYKYDSVAVNENVNTEKRQEADKNYELFTRILAYLVLIISPVIWMFAQALFYFKREEEMFVLEAFGTTPAEIKKIYLGEGAVLTLIALLSYTLFSLVITLLINLIANFMYVNPGYDYTLPLAPYLIGFFVTGTSAFMSALIPYAVYMKKKHDLIRSAASAEGI